MPCQESVQTICRWPTRERRCLRRWWAHRSMKGKIWCEASLCSRMSQKCPEQHTMEDTQSHLAKRRVDQADLVYSVQAIVLAGGPSDNALARFRAMPAVKLGKAYEASCQPQLIQCRNHCAPGLHAGAASCLARLQAQTCSSSTCPSATPSSLE